MMNSIIASSSAPRYSTTFFFTQGRSFFSTMLCCATISQSMGKAKISSFADLAAIAARLSKHTFSKKILEHPTEYSKRATLYETT